jgi:hypothetical protein
MGYELGNALNDRSKQYGGQAKDPAAAVSTNLLKFPLNFEDRTRLNNIKARLQTSSSQFDVACIYVHVSFLFPRLLSSSLANGIRDRTTTVSSWHKIPEILDLCKIAPLLLVLSAKITKIDSEDESRRIITTEKQ